MTCRWCRKPIAQGAPSPEPYWFHPHNQSVYCKVPTIGAPSHRRAEPKPEALR